MPAISHATATALQDPSAIVLALFILGGLASHLLFHKYPISRTVVRVVFLILLTVAFAHAGIVPYHSTRLTGNTLHDTVHGVHTQGASRDSGRFDAGGLQRRSIEPSGVDIAKDLSDGSGVALRWSLLLVDEPPPSARGRSNTGRCSDSNGPIRAARSRMPSQFQLETVSEAVETTVAGLALPPQNILCSSRGLGRSRLLKSALLRGP
jgi:hypothetical protein